MEVWKEAPRVGAPCVGFIPFKSPMREGAADEEDVWTVSLFMERQAGLGRAVGLCIDLTSAKPGKRRLYDAAEWTDDWDVAHVSIPCAPPLTEANTQSSPSSPPGPDKPPPKLWEEGVPPESAVEAFIAAATEFWAQPTNSRRHVAVHCVTGINVAGYMISRFLMRKAPVNRVLAAFATSRPPGIYSTELLEALWRAGLGAEASLPTPGALLPRPVAPAWHPLPPPSPRASRGASPAGSAVSGHSGTSATSSPRQSPRRDLPAVPLFGAPPSPLRADEAGGKRRAVDRPVACLPPPAKQPRGSGGTSPMPPPPPRGGRHALAAPRARTSPAESSTLRHVATPRSKQESALSLAQVEQLVAPAAGPAPSADAAAKADAPSLWCRGATLTAARLTAVVPQAHLCTWKARGERVLLLVDGGHSTLIDVHGDAWRLDPMRWPRPAPAAGSAAPPPPPAHSGLGSCSEATRKLLGSCPEAARKSAHSGLVLLGELVRDKSPPADAADAGGPAADQWRFLAYAARSRFTSDLGEFYS